MGRKYCPIDGHNIVIKKDCAIFITLNPKFKGRTVLPVNLKSLFRPIALMIPDATMITQILLYSAGFSHAEELATKIMNCFELCK